MTRMCPATEIDSVFNDDPNETCHLGNERSPNKGCSVRPIVSMVVSWLSTSENDRATGVENRWLLEKAKAEMLRLKEVNAKLKANGDATAVMNGT